ncbi:MAG: nuclear transport factor 2 family protein [Sphingobacteriaceae bacterium]|nr:nuclear transport factor 2 family protein [Sphingobacteriaceae bacterium]
MLKNLQLLLSCCLLLFSCENASQPDFNPSKANSLHGDSLFVVQTLTDFHAAAARSDLEGYFSFFTEDAVFIGTDATEHWNKASFYAYAQAPFAAGRGWHFKALERHIYLSKQGDLAWFDELLDAPYAKIARGSGVLAKTEAGWKIKQYVLSMTVPNALSDSIVAIKSPFEQLLIDSLRNQ